MQLEPGSLVAHYRIAAAIGAGGMGEVYRATDTKLGRDVALKMLPAEMASSPERLERFQREARAVAALNHPNIVTLYSIEEADGIRFLTMEVIEGAPLDALIPAGGMPLDQWLEIGLALADALAAAHEKGILHRDLKPANVMVGERLRVKILDFGLAKITEAALDEQDPATPTMMQTREGVVMGTLPYMSPEQVCGQALDARTDLFSLGVMLYEMATGERPFHGNTQAELSSAILRDPPPPLAEWRETLPADVERILHRCLEKDPLDRIASARVLYDDLRLLRRDIAASTPMAPAAAREPSRSPSGSPISGASLEQRFWVAVLPFGFRGADPSVEALAEGVTEEIITGLSRFSYLRVIARSSTSRYAGQSVDVRAVGSELGARYVLEGSIRQAGARVRIAAQLVDATSGAHLWAESYDRSFRAEEIFDLQDEIVPRIVSTIADMNGILPHAMSEALRGRNPDELTPYEAVLRSFGYLERLDAEEHALVRSALERTVRESPGDADGWAMLSFVYAEEFKHAFNVLPSSLDRALDAARRAVAAAPSNHLGYHVLAQALFFRRDLPAFRTAAERAITLNPMDGCTTAFMGILLAYAGDWQHGCELTERAMELNPHHPGWYRFATFNNAYRQRDYGAARDVALRFNMPSYFYTHAVLAAAYGQLGEHDAAARALAELLAQKPDFAAVAREELGKWYGEGELLEGMLEGLALAGLHVEPPGNIGGALAAAAGASTAPTEANPRTAIGVLPLKNRDDASRTHRPPGNLPSSVDSFVAREDELVELTALLADARLVTLTGAGGTGKTRLALEAATRVVADFADGAWLVELAPVTHVEAVPPVVADLIGAVQQPGRTVTQSVVDALRHRSLLLLLDNCEHVLDAAAELATAVTTQCPAVRILVTSRESLAVRGEHVIALQSLTDEAGARLFHDRAVAAGARDDLDMETLARLSRRLDGMPLAIELAAARSTSMRPEEIERRLDDRFRLLRGTRRRALERHQTLYGTVAWSYDLLAKLEQRVFALLSVFAGGFSLEAARAVAGGDEIDGLDVEDALAALVARSMVLASGTGDGTRYRLLETLRQFGGEQLVESGDAERIRQRHVRYFADFMTRAWAGLWSADDPPWIRAVGREFENLRAAVYSALEHRNREALEALLKPHLWWAWHSLRYEVGDWAEAALAVSPEPAFARPVAIHLRIHGGRPDDAIRLAGNLGEPEEWRDPDAVCMASLGRWDAAMVAGSPEMAEWIQRTVAAAQRTGNAAQATTFKSLQVVFKVMDGEMEEARRIAAEAHREAVAIGNQTALCWTSFFMGRAHSDDDPELALQYFDRSAEIAEQHHLPLIGGIAATEAAVLISRVEEPGRGQQRLCQAIRAFISSGDRRQLWTSAHHLAYFLTRVARLDDARSIWQELSSRQAYAAQHHRDELAQLLGPPGESSISDDELIERIRGVLDSLERQEPVPPSEAAAPASGTLERPQMADELPHEIEPGDTIGPSHGAPASRAHRPPPSVAAPVLSDTSQAPKRGESSRLAIAVLPFSDMSSGHDQEYLCEGMAEEIMTALMRIDGIRVAARTSSFRASRDGGDPSSIGERLGVGLILEGSVRTAGVRLRATAQLIEVESGFQLWSERYDRGLDDVFAVQDEIAAGVVEAVRGRLASGELVIRSRQRIGNLEAYQEYLRGRHLRYTRNDHGGALRCFNRAVALDPAHAPSWIGLAEVHALAAVYGLEGVSEALQAGKSALQTAHELQGETAEWTYVAAMIAESEWNWVDGERLLRRAIELAPDHVESRCWLGMLLAILGRLDEALPGLEHAREVDPLAPYPYAMSGLCELLAGRATSAERLITQALTFESGNSLALWVGGQTMVALGRPGEGEAFLRRAVTPTHRGGMIHGMWGWAAAAAGELETARQVLDELESRPAGAPTVVQESWLRAELGDLEGAWRVIDKAEAEGQFSLALLTQPGFDRLRDDPRFEAMAARMGLRG